MQHSVEHAGAGDCYLSFQMLDGVGIYGGFHPSVGGVEWDGRNRVASETVLSGKVGHLMALGTTPTTGYTHPWSSGAGSHRPCSSRYAGNAMVDAVTLKETMT